MRKLSISVLVALFMLVLSATTIMAASGEKKISAGKWVSTNEDTYYKITVKNDGCISLSASKVAGQISMSTELYKKVAGKYIYMSMPVYTTDNSITKKFAIEKGTYYLKADKRTAKIKYKFEKEPYKTNYCASKAIQLKKNKTIDIVNTPKNTYDRWYKIKLTKKQIFTCWSTGTVYIYDSNMDQIRTVADEDDYTKKYSREKLKKGTYYICISDYVQSSDMNNRASHITFKWK